MQIKQIFKKSVIRIILITVMVALSATVSAVTPQKQEEIKTFINDNKKLFFAENANKIEIKEIKDDNGLFKVSIKVGENEYPFYLTDSSKIVSQFVTINEITKGALKQVGQINNQTNKIVIDDKLKSDLKAFIEKYLLQNKAEVTIGEITEGDNLYKINTTFQGNEQPIYLSFNGVKMAFDIKTLADYKKMVEAQKKLTEVSADKKTNKPKVDLFVMSYCPYGTQIEKGILPVYKALGNKIDSNLRFVDYAMHDKKEMDENLLQYCIQKNEPTKIYEYLDCFLENGKSNQCLKKVGLASTNKDDSSNKNNSFFARIINKLKAIFSKKNTDTAKNIEDCVDTTDKKFKISENYKNKTTWKGQFPGFDIDKADNEKYGVQGSPTLIINGQKIQPAGRDAQSLLNAICSGFKNQPEECKQKLSTTQPSSGFGSGTSNSSGGGCGQ